MSSTQVIEKDSVSPQQTNEVDIWYTVCPVPSSASIAIARGDLSSAFEGSGVRLNSIRTHADRKVREAHYDQTQSNLFRDGGNIPPIWSRSRGIDLRVIGLTWIEHYSAVIALPESGIREPADLKGKRLGIIYRPNDQIDHARATALKGYLTALKAGGLTRDDVNFVNIEITQAQVELPAQEGALSSSAFSLQRLRYQDGLFVKALLQGHVDAIHVSSSRSEIQSLVGGHVVHDSAKEPDPFDRVSNATPIAFTVRGELLESNPDVVTAYLAQSIRTARWAKAHGNEALRFIARDTGLPEEAVGLRYSPNVTAQLEPSLTPELISYLAHQKNFLLQEGFLAGDFDIDGFVAPQPLAAARKLVDDEDRAAA